MQERGNRKELIIIDKGAHPHGDGVPRVHPQAIDSDIGENLERLQSDYIDLYLLHRDDPDYPVGPIVECLNAHCAAGRIRAFGGSNWTTQRIQEANDYAAAHGLKGFVASSPNFSLAVMKEPIWGGCISLDAEGYAWHAKNQFPLFPWSSQARGFFTGRYAPDDANAEMERVYYNDANWERYRRAEELGKRKGASANQIALAYVLHHPFPVFPLVGPCTVAELHDTLGALSISLTAAEVRWLSSGEND
jgi:aryl-alcohol dehydrogenase-like predicted oxidoreductase